MKALFLDSETSSQIERGIARWLGFGIAALILGLITFASFTALRYDWNWAIVWKYRAKLIDGWIATVWISAIALIASLVFGLISALAARSPLLFLRYLSKIYVEIIRGTPLLAQIFFFYYIVAHAADIENRYLVGVLIMATFSGAYISEIFRGGIESVGRSQLLSARAIGLSPYQTYRYVIFPQALRRSLPALAGQFANLIKDSSLLSVIAISEFMLNAQEVNALSYSTFESFFPLAIGYLALTLPIMRLARHLEKKLVFET